MVKLEKFASKFYDGYDFIIDDGNRQMEVFFGGNLDLYFVLLADDYRINKDEVFSGRIYIDKSNYALYSAFLKLYNNIYMSNPFGKSENELDDDDLFMIELMNNEEKCFYLKQKIERREFSNRIYKRVSDELFRYGDNVITWYSDETAHEVANYLKIINEKNRFILEFCTQKDKAGWDNEDKIMGNISIRFRNSGSSYDPYNACFMALYNEMQKMDDTLSLNHQIHIEEIPFIKRLEKNKGLHL